jgi:hypothetical protein
MSLTFGLVGVRIQSPSGTRSLFPSFPSAEALGYYRLPLRGMNLSGPFHCINVRKAAVTGALLFQAFYQVEVG